ncbi:sugar phosphate isomerase/epimerase [Anaerotaenia torta]|uniref:sugar phosphate isomerase/epimerase family protein n=1 Tax=Anaerotaenia torta TaxID=433293 RepID=UPI003D1EDF95
MQLGIRLHDARVLPLEERLQAVREQGFSCAHVALSKAIDEFPVSEDALTPGLAMHLKKIFQKQEIDFAVLGCYLNLTHPEPGELKKLTDTYIAHLRFASLLGCGVVGTETPDARNGSEAERRSEETYRLLKANLRPVVEAAEKLGVLLAIEPVRSHIIYDAKRARRLLDDIASPNLQIILDPVNLLAMDNYGQQTEVLEEAIELLGKETAVVHIKDYNVAGDSLASCAAGLGVFDYGPLVRFIKKQKPYMHCTLEDTKPENAAAARAYIQSLWDAL